MVICTLYVHITKAKFPHYFGTKNHWYSDKIVRIILGKTSCANCSNLFSLKYSIFDPTILHGYMYPIRTYKHGEFFYTISARKLAGKALKIF